MYLNFIILISKLRFAGCKYCIGLELLCRVLWKISSNLIGNNMKLKVIVHPAEEGGFWAEVPAILGCASQGDTLEELLANIQEAIQACLSVDLQDLNLSENDKIMVNIRLTTYKNALYSISYNFAQTIPSKIIF